MLMPARIAAPWRWLAVAVLSAAAAGDGVGTAFAQETAAVGTPPPVEILIDNFTFSPPEVTVSPGTTVKWVNHDDIPHTIVETNRTFRSKTLDTDDSFSMTFTTSGSFAYFCSLHPHMTGKVVVRAGS